MSGTSIIAKIFVPLKRQQITTFESDCLLFNVRIEANSEDPDQTALTGAV